MTMTTRTTTKTSNKAWGHKDDSDQAVSLRFNHLTTATI